MIGAFDDIEARAELVREPSRDVAQLPFEVCQSHVSVAVDECESFSISLEYASARLRRHPRGLARTRLLVGAQPCHCCGRTRLPEHAIPIVERHAHPWCSPVPSRVGATASVVRVG